MAIMLAREIDIVTIGREEAASVNFGLFSPEDHGMFTHAEASVFAITPEEFPRMLSVWEAWVEFIGLEKRNNYSLEAMRQARNIYPELTTGNQPDLFIRFAAQIGGLSNRQAEAFFWKEWFWTVRHGRVTYPDEFIDGMWKPLWQRQN